MSKYCGPPCSKCGGTERYSANSGCVSCIKARANARNIAQASPSWYSWKCMVQRCYDPKHLWYSLYGGRGITVCPQWLNAGRGKPGLGFKQFLSDMGARPDGHTLDRRNNDLGYSPENCRWSTPTQQRANQRPRAA